MSNNRNEAHEQRHHARHHPHPHPHPHARNHPHPRRHRTHPHQRAEDSGKRGAREEQRECQEQHRGETFKRAKLALPAAYHARFSDAKKHYAGNASHNNSETRQDRLRARTGPLRKFHNDVKTRLIRRFSYAAENHLDLACGRGGDLWKWYQAKLRSVTGVDLSDESIEELKTRLIKLHIENPDSVAGFQAKNFWATPDVGAKLIPWGETFKTVSVMFAAHYFFQTRECAKMFLANASNALEHGGIFYGVLTSGKAIVDLLGDKVEYHSELLRVKKNWEGKAGPFGSGYTFAMLHTVTNDSVMSGHVGEGCEEFVTDFRTFTELAAEAGLTPHPAIDWRNGFRPHRHYAPPIVFTPDAEQPHFATLLPPYTSRQRLSPDDYEMDKISKLYSAFVFVKTGKAPAPAPAPAPAMTTTTATKALHAPSTASNSSSSSSSGVEKMATNTPPRPCSPPKAKAEATAPSVALETSPQTATDAEHTPSIFEQTSTEAYASQEELGNSNGNNGDS